MVVVLTPVPVEVAGMPCPVRVGITPTLAAVALAPTGAMAEAMGMAAHTDMAGALGFRCRSSVVFETKVVPSGFHQPKSFPPPAHSGGVSYARLRAVG